MGMRKDRLGDQIRDLIAENFIADKFSDPRLSGVTITEVKMTPDLGVAYVYFRTFDPNYASASSVALAKVSGRLKTMLAKSLKIKKIPELKFFYDTSIEEASRIESLIEKIHQEDNS